MPTDFFINVDFAHLELGNICAAHRAVGSLGCILDSGGISLDTGDTEGVLAVGDNY
jgi:hypothetical protein